MNENKTDMQQIQARGTIVSYYPFDIERIHKPDLNPSTFTILKGDPINDKFSITHIDSVRRRFYAGQMGGGWQEVLCPASELCESLVNDFFYSSIAVSLIDGKRVGPALAWFPETQTEAQLKAGFKDDLKNLFDRQVEWFTKLVQDADDSWSKARSHRSVTDLQKYAATYLRLDREWLTALEIQKTMNLCKRCGTQVPLQAAVCFNCNYIINPVKFKEIEAEQALLLAGVKK